MNEDRWIKSSYSTGYNNCVEISSSRPDTVGIRDSKIKDGPALRVAPDAFRALVSMIRS